MKTKVLLADLDVIKQRRPFPNLALMKLSAYHRARGDDVFLNFPLATPDISYASCVFTWNSNRLQGMMPEISIGGSGIDINSGLQNEIEHIMPDYDLYPNVDFSMGFTSRGCLRKCPWCIVPQKEGNIKSWARIYEFWDRRRKRLLLLDNNILAAPNWRITFEDLLANNIEVDFNQGLDIRLVNENNIVFLKLLKAKQLRFAFDSLNYEDSLRSGIELLIDSGIRSRRLSFYVLIGFPGDETAIERLKILHSYNVDIYPMVYRGQNGKEPIKLAVSLEQLQEIKNIFWHGSRGNINKYLRVIGRLP